MFQIATFRLPMAVDRRPVAGLDNGRAVELLDDRRAVKRGRARQVLGFCRDKRRMLRSVDEV
jgi:hypothetical protein